MSEKDEEIIDSLKKELEEVRKKKESAVGAEVYNYYWEKEKKLKELISTLSEHYRIAKEAKTRKPIPRVDIEEIRKWLFEDTEKSRDRGEAIKEALKRKESK